MNIYVLSTIAVGFDIAELLSSEVKLAGVIGLKRRDGGDSIAGYTDGAEWCTKHDLPFVQMTTYGLSAAQDQERLRGLEIDLLLVLGWQRLIPDWLILHARQGCIGIHGSSHGINGGRGRSPQNWALILRQPEFSVSIFRIDAGIDSGPVLASRNFPLTERDDIMSSYAKVCWMSAEMLTTCIRKGSFREADAEPQSKEGFYLPQRAPEDGSIDWDKPVPEVDAFIRALTRPYPGAFCQFDAGRLIIWRARPFVIPKTCGSKTPPGCIAQVLNNGALIVRAADGWVLVDEYSVSGRIPALARGQVLPSASRDEQMGRIVQRHQTKLPTCPLHPEILQLAPRAQAPSYSGTDENESKL